MKQILLLLLVVFFVGCSKDEENENARIAGKWMLTSYRLPDGTSEDYEYAKSADEFSANGKYSGFLTKGIEFRPSSGTYSLSGDELKINGGENIKYKILSLTSSSLVVKDVNHYVGATYYYQKYNE